MKNLVKLAGLLLLSILMISCENEELSFIGDENNETIVASRSANNSAVLKATYAGCVGGVFEFDGRDFKILPWVNEYRENDDGSIYWKLWHDMIDQTDSANSFYSLDEAFWTPTDDPNQFNVNIKGDIMGGTGIYSDAGGKMKMNGKARYTPDCPYSFFIDVKIKVHFK